MIDGLSARAGIDPLELPLDRYSNLVYAFMTENMDADQKARFDADLDRPIPGITPGGVWSEEQMGDSFLALQRELG